MSEVRGRPRRVRRIAGAALSAAVLLGACAAGEPQATCAPLVPGVPLVAAPAHAPRAARLVERWRAGGTRAGEELAQPAALAASAAGEVAVVDHALAEVLVIGPDGSWRGAWGRRGGGPGELIMPVAAAWAGERLAVFDVAQSRVSFYRDGTVAAPELGVAPGFPAPVVASGEIEYVGLLSAGDVLLQYPPATTPPRTADSARLSVLRLRPGASAPDTLVTTTVGLTTAGPGAGRVVPGWPVPRVAAGPDGWLAVAAGDGSYRVVLHDSTGRARWQVCRAVPARARTDAELGAGLPGDVARLAAAPEPRVLGAIGRMVVGPDGELWVDRQRPAPFSAETLYGATGSELDVFAADGRFAGTVQVPADVSIQAIAGDRAWGIAFGPNDEPWVIGYEVVRLAPSP